MPDPSLSILSWILGSGVLMAAIALVGSVVLLLPEAMLGRITRPLVALASGTLIGGALFHLMPHAIEAMGNGQPTWMAVALGFCIFLGLDQLLHWHHCHRPPSRHVQPITWMVLLADTLHNFVGGLAVGGAFVLDLRVGLVTWIAAALHEIPQELGDFGVLVHGGWPARKALLFNLVSALTFPLGGLLAWLAAGAIDTALLVALGAGNFLYIGAADLVPEFRRSERLSTTALHFLVFVSGLGILALVHHLE